MEMIKLLFGVSFFLITSCVAGQQKIYSETEILTICNQEKRAAIAPITNVTIETGNKGSNFAVEMVLSDQFIKGKNPEGVFTECMSRMLSLNQLKGRNNGRIDPSEKL